MFNIMIIDAHIKAARSNPFFNLTNIFRPPSPPGGTTTDPNMVGDGKGGVNPPKKNDLRPIESAVLDVVANLTSLVTFDTKLKVMQQPDKFMSLPDWLRFLAWTANTAGVFSLIAIKYAATDVEYVVFPDSLKPLHPNRDSYEYSRNDKTYRAKERDIMQFRYRQHGSDILERARFAEDAFWRMYERIGSNTGVLEERDSKFGFKQFEVSQEIDQAYMMMLRDSWVARSPQGTQFKELKGQQDIEKAFEAMVRWWCFIYKLPTSLLNLDLPSHSTQNVGASYGHFLRQNLRPLINSIANAISIRTGVLVTPNYKAVEKGSALEGAQGIMKMAQSGVFHINEIRAIEGYDPVDGGDQFPDVAGAPESNKNSDGNDKN